MGSCCSREMGQGAARTGKPEVEEKLELTVADSGHVVLRLSKRKTVSRSRKEAILSSHVENASRTGACNLQNMLLKEVTRYGPARSVEE